MTNTPANEQVAESSFLLWNDRRSIQRLGGQKQLIIKLVSLFLRDAPEQLEQASHGIKHKNYDQSHIAIHSLKGTSSNLCTKSLERICDKLLAALKEQNWEKALAVHAELNAEFISLKNELEVFVRQ